MPQYEIILYVADQKKSMEFYSVILEKAPVLHVPGMTEFMLTDHVKLGIMPESSIAKILAGMTPHPKNGRGIPRCELYIRTGNFEEQYNLAIKHGAKEISKIQHRDWGDDVGYVSDMDGHIIAFAKSKAL